MELNRTKQMSPAISGDGGGGSSQFSSRLRTLSFGAKKLNSTRVVARPTDRAASQRRDHMPGERRKRPTNNSTEMIECVVQCADGQLGLADAILRRVHIIILPP